VNGEGRLLRIYETGCAAETHELGRSLAQSLLPGDVLLVGELGTGKTCFAQGVAEGLGITENVTSPTFTLMREYAGSIPLYHLDAYRLESPADLIPIGVDEYLEKEGVLLVEWGDRVRDFFEIDHLEISFEFGGGEEERRISFISHAGAWQQRLREKPRGRDGHGRG
jgi:tRNA threonylcarbamoyladenosine biosynthesis protein TsaE